MIWPVGKQLGTNLHTQQRYTITDPPIRRKDFTHAYDAQDNIGNKVIIKTLDGQSFLDLLPAERNAMGARFNTEGSSLYNCRHTHIVQVILAPFQEDDLWCIALENVPGDDLDNFCRMSLVSENQALRYIKQIGEGLSLVHATGLFHLNVKPDNIIRRRDRDEVVLIGFSFIRGTNYTMSEILGKNANYYSPIELITSQPPDQRSDVYSLAATLYFILTKKTPPFATNRINSDDITPNNANFNGISLHIVNAICQGMSIRPEDRPNSIEAWLRMLDQPTLSSTTPPPRRTYTLEQKIAIGTLIAFFIGSIGALLQGLGIFRDKPSEPTKTNSSPVPSLTSTPSPKTSSSIPSTIKSPIRDKPSEPTKTNSSPVPSLTSTPSPKTSSSIPSTIKSPSR